MLTTIRFIDLALWHSPLHVGSPPTELGYRVAERGRQLLQLAVASLAVRGSAPLCPGMVANASVLSLADAVWWSNYVSRAVQRPSGQIWPPSTADAPLLMATANVNLLGDDPSASPQCIVRLATRVAKKSCITKLGRHLPLAQQFGSY